MTQLFNNQFKKKWVYLISSLLGSCWSLFAIACFNFVVLRWLKQGVLFGVNNTESCIRPRFLSYQWASRRVVALHDANLPEE